MTILIFLLCLLPLAICLYFRHIYTPAGIQSGIWAFLIGVLVLFFNDTITLKYNGLIFIISSVAIFTAGSLIADKFIENKIVEHKVFFNNRLAIQILTIIILFGFVNPIYQIYANGFSLLDMLGREKWHNMVYQMTYNRYTNEEKSYSTIAQLFLTFAYCAPLLGGYCWFLTKNKFQKILTIISITPCFFITLTQSSKMQMIVAIFLWATGFLVCKYTNNINFKITIKTFAISLSVIFTILALSFLTMLMRASEIDSKLIDRQKVHLVEYALGSLPCFDHWFSTNYNIDKSTSLLMSANIYPTTKKSSDTILTKSDIKKRTILIDFGEPHKSNWVEVYGKQDKSANYKPNTNYNVQIDVSSDVKPQSVFFSVWNDKQKHYSVELKQIDTIATDKWHFCGSFTVPETREYNRTPDFVFRVNGSSYLELSKMIIDSSTTPQKWTPKQSNLFFYEQADTPLSLGLKTFYGITNHFTTKKREQGIYKDYVYFYKNDSANGSNVYTVFRILVEDFGKIGTLIFMFLLGFISNYAIKMIQKRKYTALFQTILSSIYIFVMWGIVTSIWAYTSIVCTFILFFIIMYVLQNKSITNWYKTVFENKTI